MRARAHQRVELAEELDGPQPNGPGSACHKPIRRRALRVFISSAKDQSNRVLLSIRDTGGGLDPEKLEDIFKAFYTTKGHGMGMGLAGQPLDH